MNNDDYTHLRPLFLCALTCAAIVLVVSVAPITYQWAINSARAQDAGIGIGAVQPPPDIDVQVVGRDGPACTITVPVKLTRVHEDVARVYVVCGVWASAAGAQAFDTDAVRGVGYQRITLGASRAYNRPVSISIKPKPETAAARGAGAGPAQLATRRPSHWACGMSFEIRGGGAPERPSPTASQDPLRATGTFRGLVWGKLPS